LGRDAERVAEAIRRFRAEQPGEPVFVVAKSGGAGVVVRAFERLDPEALERVELLAPALSPRYDLTAALRAVKRPVVMFWSPLDVMILGVGTRLFGTIDGVRTRGAGMVSFAVPGPHEPDGPRRCQYAKLRKVSWRPRMAGLGHVAAISARSIRGSSARASSPLLRADPRPRPVSETGPRG
jgi:hypothetical protein